MSSQEMSTSSEIFVEKKLRWIWISNRFSFSGIVDKHSFSISIDRHISDSRIRHLSELSAKKKIVIFAFVVFKFITHNT